jgi:hypothetical protein
MVGILGGGPKSAPGGGSEIAAQAAAPLTNGGSAVIAPAPPAAQSPAAVAQQPLNHVSALAPPTTLDPAVKQAAQIARVAAAKAAGRSSTIDTSPQGDPSPALVTKKTLLGVG